MNIVRFIAIVCLLVVSGCRNDPSSSVTEAPSPEFIEMTADFVELEGIKTVSTKTGPHRAIEYVLFSVTSPAKLKGRKILISADKPHALPTTKGSSIQFRIDTDRVSEKDTGKEIQVTIRDIKLASKGKDAREKTKNGAVLEADDITHFIENNKSTSNEYSTIDKAHKTFSVGTSVSPKGIETLKPYLRHETPKRWSYTIVLIHNKGITLSGYIEISKKNNKITKSNFRAKRY